MWKSRFNGRAIMSLILALISLSVILTATKWPLKTALFPMGIGIALLAMSTAALVLILTGKGKAAGTQVASDFSLTDEVDEATATRLTLVAFAWIVGFFLIIFFLGFQPAVAVFVFLYCKFQGREKWSTSIILTVVSWFFFWGLFIWLLDTPMQDGWIFQVLGIGW